MIFRGIRCAWKWQIRSSTRPRWDAWENKYQRFTTVQILVKQKNTIEQVRWSNKPFPVHGPNLSQEDWEKLCVDEKIVSANRFRLSLKYCGIYLRDTSNADEGTQYDDYRVVVDLEWSTYRVKDYGNKKSWVLVCELISPYHDVVIAEAGSSIREV